MTFKSVVMWMAYLLLKVFFIIISFTIDCVGVYMTHQPLWVILCHLPENGRKEIEEIVEEMKERDREERGTGMKVKKQKK